jgi:hypothetical protein
MDHSTRAWAMWIGRALTISISISMSGCTDHPLPEGAYLCHASTECPAMWFCRDDDRCWRTPDDAGAAMDAGDAGSTADTDAPPRDASTGPGVTVVARRELVALPGLEVIFHDAAGAVLESRVTDAMGRATSTVPGVGAVTLARPDLGGVANLATVWGVAVPDTITFDLTSMDGYTTRGVSLPGTFAGATDYVVSGGCNSDVNTDPTVGFSVCDFVGATNIVAFAYGADPLPLAYASILGEPELENVTFTEWHTDFVTLPTSVSGGDASATVQVRATILIRAGGIGVGAMDGRSGDLTLIPGLSLATVLVEGVATETTASGPVIREDLVAYRSGLPAAISLDVSTAPEVVSYAADRSDPEHPRVSWVTTGVVPQSVIGYFRYAPAGLVQWTVVGPGTSTELALPSLPDTHAEWRPTPEVPDYQISLGALDPPVSYAEVIAHPLGGGGGSPDRAASASMSGHF